HRTGHPARRLRRTGHRGFFRRWSAALHRALDHPRRGVAAALGAEPARLHHAPMEVCTMSRVGRVMCVRLASRIGLVVGIFFGIILLVEFLDTGRFNQTAEIAGPWTSTGLAFLRALRWSLLGLPVTVLIGAIVGLIDLHSHREMVIISASGRSIWSAMRWPILMILVSGVAMTTVVDSFAIRIYQELDAAQIG